MQNINGVNVNEFQVKLQRAQKHASESLGISDASKIMGCSVEVESLSFEKRTQSSGKRVVLHNQNLHTKFRQEGTTGETANTRSNYDDVIVLRHLRGAYAELPIAGVRPLRSGHSIFTENLQELH